MFNLSNLSSFEISVTILLIAIWGLGLSLYCKLSSLVRLKEIELRKKGIFDKNDD